ncbi:hypothetical protein FOXG_18598 [Fusarium oxysporum f. sp. lycopersici 4287]|uniref:Uncharacterized protein n=1 Tax=Fusarium oxysporum f. sp. lycopersici (strain 4287 / CBS 123668 / FGSC 9935 / NRRL 34936) TaxID=426428 RepID=A0A0J9UK85_FUSO4|nr:hypothetical protein FOXG_18598 [Fusarium oxysporum f. sp. lycopersici 4287]KNA99823.1 hypothetical protein FOXG_18598 [Fusarium oxysporum f. sp. lycopersici 4287]
MAATLVLRSTMALVWVVASILRHMHGLVILALVVSLEWHLRLALIHGGRMWRGGIRNLGWSWACVPMVRGAWIQLNRFMELGKRILGHVHVCKATRSGNGSHRLRRHRHVTHGWHRGRVLGDHVRVGHGRLVHGLLSSNDRLTLGGLLRSNDELALRSSLRGIALARLTTLVTRLVGFARDRSAAHVLLRCIGSLELGLVQEVALQVLLGQMATSDKASLGLLPRPLLVWRASALAPGAVVALREVNGRRVGRGNKH